MCYSIGVSSVTVNVRTLLIINISVFQNGFPPCATCLYAVYYITRVGPAVVSMMSY